MDDDSKKLIVVIILIVAFLGASVGGVMVYSGVSPPLTVVNSGSMQHSTSESSIGVIDTGDMVLVKDKNTLDIKTYVEGAKTGYSQFGEYGDVIIYKTPTRNIIHRAMLFMTLESSSGSYQEWSIPSLKDYDNWKVTKYGSNVKESCWNEETGILKVDNSTTLTLTHLGYENVDSSITLYNMGINKEAGYSGYITKGDNASTNKSFDQSNGIYSSLVTFDNIVSVAIAEIPWLGCIKLLINDKNVDQIPENSITSLYTTFGILIAIVVLLNVYVWYKGKQLKDEESESDEENSEK